MGLFSSIFGGQKSKSDPSSIWGGQSPFLRGLYERGWNASLSGGIPGYGMPGMGGMGGGDMAAVTAGYGNGGVGGYGMAPMGTASRMYSPGWSFANDPRLRTGKGTPPPPMPMGADPLGILGGQLLGAGMGMAGNLGMLGQAGNPFAQAQIGQFGQELGNIYQRNILPGIRNQFGLANQLGGDRQALAMGEAAGRLGEQFRGGALDILGRSSELALGANQAGLGSLGGLFGLGNAAMFGSLPGLSSLLGGPTILGGGSSSSSTPGVMGSVSRLVDAFIPG